MRHLGGMGAPVTVIGVGCELDRLFSGQPPVLPVPGPPGPDDLRDLFDAIAGPLRGGNAVIVIAAEWLPEEALRGVRTVHSLLQTDRVAVHVTPLPPLAASVLAALGAALAPVAPVGRRAGGCARDHRRRAVRAGLDGERRRPASPVGVADSPCPIAAPRFGVRRRPAARAVRPGDFPGAERAADAVRAPDPAARGADRDRRAVVDPRGGGAGAWGRARAGARADDARPRLVGLLAAGRGGRRSEQPRVAGRAGVRDRSRPVLVVRRADPGGAVPVLRRGRAARCSRAPQGSVAGRG